MTGKSIGLHFVAASLWMPGFLKADTQAVLPFTSSGMTWNDSFGSPTGASVESTPGSYTIGTSTGLGATGRAVIKYDISSWLETLPEGETLHQAKLRIHHRSTQGSPAPGVVYHSLSDNQPEILAGHFQDSSYAPTDASWPHPQPPLSWIELDVTGQVAAGIAQGGAAIFSSFRLQQANDLALSSGNVRYLIDRSQGNPAQPPQLVLTTTGPYEPPVPDLFHTSVSSPDGAIVVEIQQANLSGVANYPDAPALYYQVSKDGTVVLDWSPLGLERSDGAFLSSFQLNEEIDAVIDENYPLLHGKASLRRNHAHEKTLVLGNAMGTAFHVIFRVFDDGMAFRYYMPGTGTATVLREISGYRLPAASRMWIHPRHLSYELPLNTSAVENLSNQRWGYLAMAGIAQNGPFLLLHETGVYETYAGSHLTGPANRLFTLTLPQPSEGNEVGPANPSAALPWSTPWRAAMIGSLGQIVQSGIATDLAEPFEPADHSDVSWIRPGKSAWSWYSQGTGTAALQREYVDAAADFGWEHILIDANWQNFPNAAQAIQDIVSYAGDRDIGVHLWYNSGGPAGSHTSNPNNGPVDFMLDPAIRRAEMEKIRGWGVAGIKVDYMNGDKQERFAQYIGVLKDAMDHQLMVNFHGSTLPRGWRRTYPNFMTTEAVRGAEYYKFNNATAPSAIDNVRFALVRNPIGPMDYTPVTFADALAQKNLTYAHQLALSVVFESGIQHFADRADSNSSAGYRAVFAQAPYVGDFLSKVPAAWDETRLLEGHPDSHLVIARRKDDTWFIGGINGTAGPREISFHTSTLTPLGGSVEIIREASDNSFQIQSPDNPSLQIPLAANGGFVAIIAPDQNPFYQFIKPLIGDYTLRTPDGDADGDGISNLIEYFLGSDPLDDGDGRERLPRVVWIDGNPHLTHGKRDGAVVSESIYESSRDLSAGSWQPLLNQSPVERGGGSILLALPDAEDRMFYRVRIRP